MKYLTAFLLTFLATISFVTSVSAQPAQTKCWYCLEAKKPLSGKGNAAFRQTLYVKDGNPLPEAGKQTYVIECIATSNGQICTTGKADTDVAVYGQDHVAQLGNNFTFVGLYAADGITALNQPIIAAGDGVGNVEWESRTAHLPRKFTAMQYCDSNTSPAGEIGGQQQGTFDFEHVEGNCTTITWDPWGRVFDAGTLEPVQTNVTLLLTKDGTTYVPAKPEDMPGGDIQNPYPVGVDGRYSFMTEDGLYKLQVAAPYVMAKSLGSIHPNYTLAYSDIYPGEKGDVIEEKGKVEHRDIAVETVGTNTEPTIIHFLYADYYGRYILEGTSSHPLTKVNLLTAKVSIANPSEKTPYRTIPLTTLDASGIFTNEKRIIIDPEAMGLETTPEYTEVISDVQFIKQDLRLLTKPNTVSAIDRIYAFLKSIIKPVEAAGGTFTIHIEPILRYLDGFAYDTDLKAIPNAKVEIYEKNSSKPYTTTTADSAGHFKISSSRLPNTSYEIRYVTQSGSIIKTTTSTFIGQNLIYLSGKQIDLYVPHDANDKVIPTKPVQKQSSSKSAITGGVSSAQNAVAAGKTNPIDAVKQQLTIQILAVIAIIVVLIAGGIIAFVLLTKKKPQPPEML